MAGPVAGAGVVVTVTPMLVVGAGVVIMEVLGSGGHTRLQEEIKKPTFDSSLFSRILIYPVCEI